jgi:hypothetical protein
MPPDPTDHSWFKLCSNPICKQFMVSWNSGVDMGDLVLDGVPRHTEYSRVGWKSCKGKGRYGHFPKALQTPLSSSSVRLPNSDITGIKLL